MRQISVPTSHQVKDTDNLPGLVWNAVKAHPHRALFLQRASASPTKGQPSWQPVSAQEFADQITSVAQGLIAAGLMPGDRVGLMAKTRYEWTLMDFALWAAGVVTVPIYETSSAEQVSWILGDSKAVGVIIENSSHRHTVDAVRAELPQLNYVWQIDLDAVEQLKRNGSEVDPRLVHQRCAALQAQDIATLIYTSGTTGRPKGCQLTHRNLLTVAHGAVDYVREVFEADNPSTVMFLPLAHVLARAVVVMCVAGGVTIAHASDIKDLSGDLLEVKPTFLLAVPRVFEKLYERMNQQSQSGLKAQLFRAAATTAVARSKAQQQGHTGRFLRARHAVFNMLVYRKIRKALGGRLTICVSGGAALTPQLQHFFCGVGVTVLEGYGLTETSSATNVNVVRTNRIGTVGRPMPGLSVRVDNDNQVRIKGDTVFRGYYNNPEATASQFDDDGYFLTGDLGSLDDDGFLTITGRAKEIVVTAGGKNVFPTPLEDLLRTHPLISQAIIVGDAQPYIACLITLDREALPAWLQRNGLDANLHPQQLVDNPNVHYEIQQAVDRANSSVSKAEAIKRFAILGDDFTEEDGQLTPSLKLKRQVITTQYADDINTLYALPRI